MNSKLMLDKAVVCIIGLGYVGLPLAEVFSRSLKVTGFDPLLTDIEDELGIRVVPSLGEVSKVDGIILTVAHEAFQEITMDKLKSIMKDKPILIDVRGFFDSKEALEKGFYYRTL